MVANNETTTYLWRDCDDDLLDAALAPRSDSPVGQLLAAINHAIAILGESSSGPAVEAESVLRAVKRKLGL